MTTDLRSAVPGDIPHVLAFWRECAEPTSTDTAAALTRLLRRDTGALAGRRVLGADRRFGRRRLGRLARFGVPAGRRPLASTARTRPATPPRGRAASRRSGSDAGARHRHRHGRARRWPSGRPPAGSTNAASVATPRGRQRPASPRRYERCSSAVDHRHLGGPDLRPGLERHRSARCRRRRHGRTEALVLHDH